MLLSFKVKNFRSIKDEVVLDLQATSDSTMAKQAVFERGNVSLLKTAGIYGPNASGKSNVLKAFFIFKTMILKSLAMSGNPLDLPSEYFKLSSETKDKPSLFEMTFLLDEKIFTYGFEIDRKKVCKEWLKEKKGKKTLFSRTGQTIEHNKNYFKEATAVLKKQTLERVLFLSLLHSHNGEMAKKIVQTIQNTGYISGTQRGETLDYAFGQFINNPKMAKKIKNFIVKADFGVIDIKANQKMILAKDVKDIPDKFKELLFKEDSKVAERELKFIHRKFNKENVEIKSQELNFLSEESEGTQQMFALSAPIIDTLENGKVLLIDEIDASLHPVLCQYLISIFNSKVKNKNNAQLIFTTHDLSLLSEDLLRRDQVYFTDKNKYGATSLFSLFDIAERKGVSFAKRYMEGRYNALPYISDFEDLKLSKQ